jgi:hypothetical protein
MITTPPYEWGGPHRIVKALILGGSGMLGHKLWQACAPRFDRATRIPGSDPTTVGTTS